jgi:hypothetical protein
MSAKPGNPSKTLLKRVLLEHVEVTRIDSVCGAFNELAFEEVPETGSKQMRAVFVSGERIEFLSHVCAGRAFG